MYTYLIVEDEPLVRKGTMKKIEKLSLDLTCIGECANGQEALHLLHSHRPHILITDMNMPIMDGVALLDGLNKEFPTMSIIVISGYKDFDYAKKALESNVVDYILKPFGRDDIRIALEHALHRITSNSIASYNYAQAELEKEKAKVDYDLELLKNLLLGYSNHYGDFTSAMINMLTHTYHFYLIAFYSNTAIDQDLLTQHLEHAAHNEVPLMIAHPTTEHLLFGLIFIDPSTPCADKTMNLDAFITRLQSLAKTDSIYTLSGISQYHTSIHALHTAYQESIHAMNRSLSSHHQVFYHYHKESSYVFEYSWIHYDEFLFRVETGDAEQVKELTHHLFTFFDNQSECPLYAIKLYCYELANSIQTLFSSYFMDIEFTRNSNSIQSIMNILFTPVELEDYFTQFFLNVSTLMKEYSIYSASDTIENIKLYIAKNYSKDITVEFISCLFYLNRSYLSHSFKKKCGVSMTDYLNDVRIQQAKEQLQKSSKPLYQVAKSVGYTNVKYFFRVFKKKEGITPRQYKSQCLHQ